MIYDVSVMLNVRCLFVGVLPVFEWNLFKKPNGTGVKGEGGQMLIITGLTGVIKEGRSSALVAEVHSTNIASCEQCCEN
jgi:hypothetical protein